MKLWNKFLALFISDEFEREKAMASADHMPWVKVVEVAFADPRDPSTGSFELDWNNEFVAGLIEAGYGGKTEEEVVEQWFNDLARGIIGDNI